MSRYNKHKDYGQPLQIDGDPLERRGEDGKRRWFLNHRERRELLDRSLAAKVVELFAQNVEVGDIAKALEVSPEQVSQAMLDKDSDPAVRRMFLKRMAEKVLDLTRPPDRARIAEELGITKRQLDRLMQSDDWAEVYAEYFGALRGDPIIDQIKREISEDLAPRAFQVYREFLTSDKVPYTVRYRAAKDILTFAGVQPEQKTPSDRSDATAFLAQLNINVGQPLAIPPEYQKAVQDVQPEEIIEGEARDLGPAQEPI